MSYILDALQRAHAQRQLGEVPGLHTPPPLPIPPASATQPPQPSAPRYAWGAGVALLALLAAGLLTSAHWWPLATPGPQAATTAPVNGQVATAPPTATSQTTGVPAAVVPAAAATPPTVPSPPTAPSTPTAGLPKPTVVAPAPKQEPQPSAQAPAPSPAPAPVQAQAAEAENGMNTTRGSTTAAPATSPTTPPTVAAWPLLGDLAPSLRAEVPPLTITGAVYASNPSQRLLIVNNQVLTEGATVAPGVTLEEIQPQQSVFSTRGQRFRLPH
ncbi:MAG: general secretion pathway protein GspB [Burkholderiales bacterium]|nr:general secretion pathway protein GspB [Burkholderiales bacterium]